MKPYFLYLKNGNPPAPVDGWSRFIRDGYNVIEPLTPRLQDLEYGLSEGFKAFYSGELSQKPLQDTIYLIWGMDHEINDSPSLERRMDEIMYL